MKKAILAVFALLAVVALCACSANSGIIAPLDSDSEGAIVAFNEAGSLITASERGDASLFAYKWSKPVQEARVWADLYRDGQYVSEPVEINVNDLTSATGTIGLFTDEEDGTTQRFALILTNGTGSEAKAYMQTGELEIGEAMSPRSTIGVEDTQITMSDETNVLLVMHDGPDLTTEMNNDEILGQTEQLIEGSTYTLVLNCMFA